jgi:hypothetical protein
VSDKSPKAPKADQSARLDAFDAALADLAGRLDDLCDRLACIEQHMPEARRLSRQDVEKIVAENAYAEFEVLGDWRAGSRALSAGAIIRADHLAHLGEYVQAGLALAVPVDVSARVRQAQALAAATREQAQAVTELAKAKLASQLGDQLAGALDSAGDAPKA